MIVFGSGNLGLVYASGEKHRLARAEIESRKGERESIVITEIPYQVNKARLIEKIAELVREKKIEGIADLRDESDRDGMRMVIELKREAIGPGSIRLTPMPVRVGFVTACRRAGSPTSTSPLSVNATTLGVSRLPS